MGPKHMDAEEVSDGSDDENNEIPPAVYAEDSATPATAQVFATVPVPSILKKKRKEGEGEGEEEEPRTERSGEDNLFIFLFFCFFGFLAEGEKEKGEKRKKRKKGKVLAKQTKLFFLKKYI